MLEKSVGSPGKRRETCRETCRDWTDLDWIPALVAKIEADFLGFPRAECGTIENMSKMGKRSGIHRYTGQVKSRFLRIPKLNDPPPGTSLCHHFRCIDAAPKMERHWHDFFRADYN